MQNTDLKKKQFNLNLFLRKWQANNKQTDDILLLGISPSTINKKYVNLKKEIAGLIASFKVFRETNER